MKSLAVVPLQENMATEQALNIAPIVAAMYLEFNHDKVGCNMNGQHRTLPCFDCHNAGNYGGSSPLCVSCHKKDADNYDQAHKAYTSCADCHNPTTWVPAIGGIRVSICR